MRKTHQIFSRPRSGAWTIVLLFLVVAGPFIVFGETDFAALSDDDLLKQLHLSAARQELENRIQRYTEKESIKLENLAAESYQHRSIPDELSREELIQLLAYWRSNDLPRLAAKRLSEVYAGSTDDEKRLIYKQVREFGLNNVGKSTKLVLGGHVPEAKLESNCFARHAAIVFPPQEASKLLEGMFLGRSFDDTVMFLTILSQRKTDRGANTVETLRTIWSQLPPYGTDAYFRNVETIGSIQGQIYRILGECGDAGLEFLKSTDWQGRDAAISALGAIGTEDARQMLVALYQTLDPRKTQTRLTILMGLSSMMKRAKDRELRDFLRQELPPLLVIDAADVFVSTLGNAVAVAERTEDSYYIPHLKSLLEDAQGPAVEQAKERQIDSDEEWVQRKEELIKTIQDAIDSLERSTTWDDQTGREESLGAKPAEDLLSDTGNLVGN
ncbi:MAG: HEAT repeat domain-containing protein [Candidatus Hydrogenedentes bacterium]|nr:HEAT repeat domain-containing protein [Candidatus Hydrogenedentota bacterium]